MEHIINQESVRAQITRQELCDLLIGTAAISAAHPEATKWVKLHDKLREILDNHDKQAKEKGWR